MLKELQQIAAGGPMDIAVVLRRAILFVLLLDQRVKALEVGPVTIDKTPSTDLNAAGAGAILEPDGDELDRLLQDRVAAALRKAGYTSVDSIAAASDEELQKVNGIGPSTLAQLRALVPRKDGER